MNFLLKNISWAQDDQHITADIRVSRGLISKIGNLNEEKEEGVLDFRNHFLYPGLINAHDHLEMNLYPLMGNLTYQNYTAWAKDIYKPKESPIKEIERTDIEDRLMWGAIKNLISGVTAVVHHNPWKRILGSKNFPIKVIKTEWAHSLAFDKDAHKKFNQAKAFVIHAAEGIDDLAKQEIVKLSELGMLKNNSVLVHAVGVDQSNLQLIEKSNTSIIWCPSSNLFMFGKTAPISMLKSRVKVALGTDSTMTGMPTLFDEMRAAKKTEMATTKEIYEMVTSIPAKIFRLELPEIKVGRKLDGFISPVINSNYYENLLLLEPSLVSATFVSGDLRFADKDLASLFKWKGSEFFISRKEKWIAYDIHGLKRRIESKISTIEKNPLWRMIFS